jgi:hypothetical protein
MRPAANALLIEAAAIVARRGTMRCLRNQCNRRPENLLKHIAVLPHHVLALAATMTGLLIAPMSASAQDADAGPPASATGASNPAVPSQGEPAEGQATSVEPAALRRVATDCATDAARLCPELGEETTARDETICLKDFQVDLSPRCRSALRAVVR